MEVKGYNLDRAFAGLKTAVLWSTFVVVILYGTYVYNNAVLNQAARRKEIVCPSFLSIARSARDTLIVMRNEPLCNRYVLDNLQ